VNATLRKHWYEVDGWLDGWLGLLSSGIQIGFFRLVCLSFCSNIRLDLLPVCFRTARAM
jgi:hypothetical protein